MLQEIVSPSKDRFLGISTGSVLSVTWTAILPSFLLLSRVLTPMNVSATPSVIWFVAVTTSLLFSESTWTDTTLWLYPNASKLLFVTFSGEKETSTSKLSPRPSNK